MPASFKKFTRDLLALVSGLLLVFAFAPFHQFYLAIIAPALLLWTLLNCSPRRAALRGFLFGLGLFGLGVSWVYISIHTYGDTPLIFAILITAGFVMLLACFTALNMYLWRRFFSDNKANSLLLAFPILWVVFEWLRSCVLTGFPWFFLGYSQSDSLLSHLAPIGGVYLVSLVVAMQAALLVFCIYRAWYKKHDKALCFYSLLGIAAIWLFALVFQDTHWSTQQSTALKVALIQSNVPQSLKWDPLQAQKTLDLYQRTTDTLWNNNIIVWPEGAVPILKDQAQAYLNALNTKAKQHNTAIILGLPVKKGEQYYNAILGLGSAMGIYYKRHLVPFGEYLPFENLLRGLINFFNLPMSDFSEGPEYQKKINLLGFDIATYLCYEIAYPAEFLTQFPESELIVTLSNDAWFGDSFAASQQLQIAQMRSMETARYQLVATDNGVTAIINPEGKIMSQLPRFEFGVLEGKVFAMSGATPLMRLGSGPLLFILFVLLGLAIAFRPELHPRDQK